MARSSQPAVRSTWMAASSTWIHACEVVVSHGGTGTMRAALAYGLPMVNIPIAADQPENAARCAAVGCGLTVDAEQRTPDTIRMAVRTVLAEPSYRVQAHRLQAEIRTLPSMDTAVGLLERLANRRTSPEPEPLQ